MGYDSEGEYVKTWCPELRNIPNTKVHEPWTLSEKEQETYQCRIGSDYPRKIPTSSYQHTPRPQHRQHNGLNLYGNQGHNTKKNRSNRKKYHGKGGRLQH